MRRILLTLMVLLPLAGCSQSSRPAGVSDMAAGATVHEAVSAKDLSWHVGRLSVANADSGDRACLTLMTPEGEYALESAEDRLDAEVWQKDGALVESLTGIVATASGDHDPTVVVAYGGGGLSVLGSVVDSHNKACPSLEVLAFVDATRSERKGKQPIALPAYADWRAGKVAHVIKDTKKCLVLKAPGGPFELHPGKFVLRPGKPTEVYGARAEGVTANCGLEVLRVDDLRSPKQ